MKPVIPCRVRGKYRVLRSTQLRVGAAPIAGKTGKHFSETGNLCRGRSHLPRASPRGSMTTPTRFRASRSNQPRVLDASVPVIRFRGGADRAARSATRRHATVTQETLAHASDVQPRPRAPRRRPLPGRGHAHPDHRHAGNSRTSRRDGPNGIRTRVCAPPRAFVRISSSSMMVESTPGWQGLKFARSVSKSGLR